MEYYYYSWDSIGLECRKTKISLKGLTPFLIYLVQVYSVGDVGTGCFLFFSFLSFPFLSFSHLNSVFSLLSIDSIHHFYSIIAMRPTSMKPVISKQLVVFWKRAVRLRFECIFHPIVNATNWRNSLCLIFRGILALIGWILVVYKGWKYRITKLGTQWMW